MRRNVAIVALYLLTALAGCLDEEAGDLSLDGGGGQLQGFYLGPSFGLFFAPDGEVAYATKWKVAEEFDFVAARKVPANMGKWRVQKRKVLMDWNDGRKWVAGLVSTDELSLESTGVKQGFAGPIRRPKAVAPTITGRFRRGNFSYFGVDNTGTAQGSASSEHLLTFYPDGTVSVYDETGVFLEHSGEYLSTITRLTGRYSISGLMLTITEPNGKISKFDLWVKEGTSERPRLIVYDHAVYLAP